MAVMGYSLLHSATRFVLSCVPKYNCPKLQKICRLRSVWLSPEPLVDMLWVLGILSNRVGKWAYGVSEQTRATHPVLRKKRITPILPAWSFVLFRRKVRKRWLSEMRALHGMVFGERVPALEERGALYMRLTDREMTQFIHIQKQFYNKFCTACSGKVA